MQQKLNGEVVSFASMQALFKATAASYTANPAANGWSVQYKYRCPCGDYHSVSAFNIWPTGDHKTDVVEHTCPKTGEANSVELVRPT